MSNNYIEQKKNTHLYFKSGQDMYAIDSNSVLEIMKLPLLDYPQKMPNNIVGLLKYYNFMINIIDVRFYLNKEVTSYNSDNELLIIKTDESILGIITDKVVGILTLDTSQVNNIPFSDDNMIAEAIYKHNFETIYILNVYAIEKMLKQQDLKLLDVEVNKLMPCDKTSLSVMKRRADELVEKSALKRTPLVTQTENQYISFNLCNDFYGLPLDSVIEITQYRNITPIPGVPSFIKGIMNLRGAFVTVIDLKEFLELSDDTMSEKSSIIIVDCNELRIALLVDKINEIFEVEDIVNISNTDNTYVYEIFKDNVLYNVLDLNKLTSDKQLMISNL